MKIRWLFLWLLASPCVAGAQDMVRIAAGEFTPLYGEKEALVEVDAFQLDIYPVTNGQFKVFVEDNPKWQRNSVAPLFSDEGYLDHWQDNLVPGPIAPDNAPVTNVSWFAAKAYCESMGKRLPALNEWEYAARASQKQPDAADDEAFSTKILDWYSRPSQLPIPDVGTTRKNYWGLWDMHGLVWEWVMDFNAVLMTGESRVDAGGLGSQLFCAGGAIGAADPNDYATFMRFAMRASVKASYTVQNMGFRCAMDAS